MFEKGQEERIIIETGWIKKINNLIETDDE